MFLLLQEFEAELVIINQRAATTLTKEWGPGTRSSGKGSAANLFIN
jgi:hypothetical protein